MDTPILTPHQTPPSTASIPPSVSVVAPTGGVGHATSSHLPPSSSSSTPMQLLTQHSSMQPYQTAAQLLSTGSLQTTPTPTGMDGVALSRTANMANLFLSTESSLATPPALHISRLQQQHNLATYPALNATMGGLSFQQLQQQQQRQQQPHSGGLPQGMSNYHSTLTPQALSGASLSAGSTGVGGVMGGGGLKPTIPPTMSTTHLAAGPSGVGANMFSHLTQSQARQFHALTGGRGSLSPLRPPGGPDGSMLPPPAKRHAMEYGHHPGTPQHLPPSASMLTQQTPHIMNNYVPQLGLMLGRAPSSSPQVHAIDPSMAPSAAGFAGDRRGGASTAAWQQHK